MTNDLTIRLKIFDKFFDLTKDIDIPEDVRNALSYDISQDLANENKIFTVRILDILSEYDIDKDEIENGMRDIADQYKDVIVEHFEDHLNEDELFEFTLTTEDFIARNGLTINS